MPTKQRDKISVRLQPLTNDVPKAVAVAVAVVVEQGLLHRPEKIRQMFQLHCATARLTTQVQQLSRLKGQNIRETGETTIAT